MYRGIKRRFILRVDHSAVRFVAVNQCKGEGLFHIRSTFDCRPDAVEHAVLTCTGVPFKNTNLCLGCVSCKILVTFSLELWVIRL